MADRFTNLDVDELAEGENVRFELTEIKGLADDIRRRGVLQPIVVIPNNDGTGPEVLIGHRRLAAAKVAGLKTIPCIMRAREIPTKRLLDQVAENSQRVQLTPIEEATACRTLLEMGFTPIQVGKQMHKSDTWVTNRIRLLSLPQCLQDAIHARKVTVTRALDLPTAAISTREQVENLAAHLNDGGLQAWWEEHYANCEARPVPRESFKPPKPPPEAKFSLTMHFDKETSDLFETLVKASSVFTKKANVVTALLNSQLESVRDNMQWDGWEEETLRYIGGMTEVEVAAFDVAEDARAAEWRAADHARSSSGE